MLQRQRFQFGPHLAQHLDELREHQHAPAWNGQPAAREFGS